MMLRHVNDIDERNNPLMRYEAPETVERAATLLARETGEGRVLASAG